MRQDKYRVSGKLEVSEQEKPLAISGLWRVSKITLPGYSYCTLLSEA